MQKIQQGCFKIIAVIGMLIFGFLTWYTWRFTHRMYTDNEDIVVLADPLWKHVFAFILVMILLVLLSKTAEKLSEKTMHYIVIGVCVCVTAFLFVLISGANAYAVVDQQHINGTAMELAKGNFIEMNPGEYFSIVPYQLGLVKLFSWIYTLSGDQIPDTIRYVQAVCVGLSIYAGFLIIRQIWHQIRIELLYVLCMIAFFPLHLYSMFLYGETLGVCGTLWGVWFFLKMNESDKPKKMLIWGIPAMLAVAVAYIARSALIVVWIAMMIIQLLIFLSNKKIVPVILTVGILISMVGGQNLLIHSIEKESGLSLDNGMPIVMNLAMGLQGNIEEGDKPGAYNGYNWNTFRDYDLDQEASSVDAVNNIRERLDYWKSNPKEFVLFFKTKLLNQWNEPGYGAFSMTRFMEEPEEWINSMYYGQTNEIMYGFLNQYQAISYFMTFLFFVVLLKKNNRKETEYLMGLIMIGGIIFSALYEAKSRYVYPFAVVGILYMAVGTTLCYDYLKEFCYGWLKKHMDKTAVKGLETNAEES